MLQAAIRQAREALGRKATREARAIDEYTVNESAELEEGFNIRVNAERVVWDVDSWFSYRVMGS